MSAPWPFFPVFMRLADRPVLLVGGGEVGLRKARLLLRAGAHLRLVAGDVHAGFAELGVTAMAAQFDAEQLEGCALAIAATDDAGLNRRVAAAADARGVPVNVVDDPTPSSFITPAIIDRAPLMLALSTGGHAPVLARRLRERLEAELAHGLGRLAAFIGRRRESQRTLPVGQRRRLWEAFLDSPGAEAAMRGEDAVADAELQRLAAGADSGGEVWLVGAGPGDPELLTLRALRLMQACDVVLYDQLVSPQILDLVRRDAERIDVGKRRSRHTLPQHQINAELVRLARQGKRVLRLKGGDPFVFGRGGEEIAELAAQGIPFQVVPGITAASGCAAYAGIPLTHRDYAQACILVTGHPRADGALQLHWDVLARPGQTVVIYMGLGTLAACCEQLRAHGLPDDWPAAVVEQGTLSAQRVVASTLAELPARVEAAGIAGPSLVIVGEVVRLREQLDWFGAKPA